MRRVRTAAAVSAAGVILLALWATSSARDVDLDGVFIFDAVYDERFGTINVTFTDTTGMTTSTVLEIQGMPVSYQKTFSGPVFMETIQFGDPPSLGWKVHPLTVVAEHPEMGRIGIKTEVYVEGQEPPEIIISRP